MVLALAPSSEPWCFPAGSCFFSKLFYCQQYCQQLQAIESRQKGFFSRISAFFEAVLLPVAAGNRISRSLEKRRFSRILGYFFSTLFYCLSKKVIFLGFQAGRFLPAAAFFRFRWCSTVSISSLEKGCFSRRFQTTR